MRVNPVSGLSIQWLTSKQDGLALLTAAIVVTRLRFQSKKRMLAKDRLGRRKIVLGKGAALHVALSDVFVECVSRICIWPPRRDEHSGVLIGTGGRWRSELPVRVLAVGVVVVFCCCLGIASRTKMLKMLHLPHAIVVRLHVRKSNVVIFTPVKAGTVGV